MMVGDAGVGKSSLMSRFVDDTFSDKRFSTISIDLSFRTIVMDHERIKLQTLDATGQPYSRATISGFYQGVDGIIIVYDITNKQSFDNIRDYLDEINLHAKQNVCKLIIANKSDLENKRKVKYNQLKSFANELKVSFFETSAKNASNIEQAFLNITSQIKIKIENPEKHNKNSRSIPSQQLNDCCLL